MSLRHPVQVRFSKKFVLWYTSKRYFYVTWLILHGLSMWHDSFSTDFYVTRLILHELPMWNDSFSTDFVCDMTHILWTWYVTWLILYGLAWHDSFYTNLLCNMTHFPRNSHRVYVKKVTLCVMTHTSRNSCVTWLIFQGIRTWHDPFLEEFACYLRPKSTRMWHDSFFKEFVFEMTHSRITS